MPHVGDLLRLLQSFAKKGGELVVLAAREPVASPTWDEVSHKLISECKKLGLTVGVNLSAHMVCLGIQRLGEIGGVASASVSIDGIHGTHDLIRGINEEKHFRGISGLNTVAERVSISVTAMRQNLSVLQQTIEFAIKLVGNVFVATVATTGESSTTCKLSNDDFISIDQNICTLKIGDNVVLEITPQSLNIDNLVAQGYFRKFYLRDGLPHVETIIGNEWRILDGVCQFLSGIIRVTSDGVIRVSYDLETQPIGHISEPTEVIWERLNNPQWFASNFKVNELATYAALVTLPWE